MREHVDVTAVVDLTKRLVAVDTQNPPGNERLAADVARAALDRFGATFTEIEPEPGRVSLVATVGPGGRPTLLVNGHLDVVPVDPTKWQHDPFGGEVAGDKLYGRGTTDMKGGIAAAIEALAVLQRAGVEPSCDVVFHLVADEELGGALGTKALLDEGLLVGDACLDPEPTSMQLCVAERGLFTAHITTYGTPGHGSEPAKGVSAVEKLAKVVLALHAADFGDPTHPLLGRPTANAGKIVGGAANNIIAEKAELWLDRRVLPGGTPATAEAGIRALIDAIDDPDLRYDLDMVVFGEASELDVDHPFVSLLGQCVKSVTGDAPDVIGMTFSTDARFVRNQAGIPAVVCGPGDVDRAHTIDEWVSIGRLADATAVYAELYASFGR